MCSRLGTIKIDNRIGVSLWWTPMEQSICEEICFQKKHRGRNAKHNDGQYHHHDGCGCLLSPAEQVKSRERQNNIGTEKYCASNGACEIRGCKGRHHKLLEGRLGISTGIYIWHRTPATRVSGRALGVSSFRRRPGSFVSIDGKYCGGFSNLILQIRLLQVSR